MPILEILILLSPAIIILLATWSLVTVVDNIPEQADLPDYDITEQENYWREDQY